MDKYLPHVLEIEQQTIVIMSHPHVLYVEIPFIWYGYSSSHSDVVCLCLETGDPELLLK